MTNKQEVCTVTSYGLYNRVPEFTFWQKLRFCLFHIAPGSLYNQRILVVLSLGVKRPEREPAHSPPSIVENKDVCSYVYTVGRDSSVGIASSLWTGRDRDQNLLGGEILRVRQEGPGAHSVSCKTGTAFLVPG